MKTNSDFRNWVAMRRIEHINELRKTDLCAKLPTAEEFFDQHKWRLKKDFLQSKKM